jgi:AraC-like DNA-binding protein
LRLYIKYMVSNRCKLLVRKELNRLGLSIIQLKLGQVDIKEKLSDQQYKQLKTGLAKSGLELIDDRKAILIEMIKNVIIEMVHYAEKMPKINYSDYISEKLNHDYTYLSNIFSEVNGITIEQFIIAHKIERVKELLFYDELNISEISYKLNYSSVAHLSSQFKKVTGLTPTLYKKLKNKKRNPLDAI